MKRTKRSYLNNPYLNKKPEKSKRKRKKKEQTKRKSRLQKWLDAIKKFMVSVKTFFKITQKH